MSQSDAFWDKIAQRYSQSPVEDEESYQRKLKITREYLRPDMELLDIGCGTGSTAIVHAPNVKHIDAIDISANMLEIAEAKARDAGIENITFRHAAVDNLQLPPHSYDVVLTLSLLHLVKDKSKVIASIFDMLKPGGIFVSSTVCIGDSMKFMKYFAPIGKLFGILPILRVFGENELAQSITDAGFSIEHQWRPGKGRAVFIVAKKPE